MKLQVAETAGFCSGVRRAVEMVEEAAREGRPVCTLGPIVHNGGVVRRLEGMGVSVIQRPEECPPGAMVVIRAHGVPLSVTRELEERGIPYRDATCPLWPGSIRSWPGSPGKR